MSGTDGGTLKHQEHILHLNWRSPLMYGEDALGIKMSKS